MRPRCCAGLLVFLAATGCGYRLVGGSPEGFADRIWIGPVEDETNEPLFGSSLRAALARAAVDRAGAAPARVTEASGFLTVTVRSVTERATAFVAGDHPRGYVLMAEAEAALRRGEKEVVWKGLRLRAEREFAAGPTVEETQANKGRALDELARDLSGEILRRVALAGSGTDR